MGPPEEPPPRSGLWSRRVQLGLLHTLSLSRLVFAALFLFTSDALLRAGLIVVSGLTDVLDGWIARHARLTTRLGALIDPVGDRGFAAAALLALLLDGLLTPLEVCVLLLRDVYTALGYLFARLMPAFRAVEFKARRLGKTCTLLQTVTMLAALLWPAAVPALVTIVGVLAVAAMVDYSRAVWRARAHA